MIEEDAVRSVETMALTVDTSSSSVRRAWLRHTGFAAEKELFRFAEGERSQTFPNWRLDRNASWPHCSVWLRAIAWFLSPVISPVYSGISKLTFTWLWAARW